MHPFWECSTNELLFKIREEDENGRHLLKYVVVVVVVVVATVVATVVVVIIIIISCWAKSVSFISDFIRLP